MFIESFAEYICKTKLSKPPIRVVFDMVAGQWERKQESPLYIIPLVKTQDAEITVQNEGTNNRQVVEWIPGSLITIEKECRIFLESGRVIFIACFDPPPIPQWILVPIR
jgi:hypothetical protein